MNEIDKLLHGYIEEARVNKGIKKIAEVTHTSESKVRQDFLDLKNDERLKELSGIASQIGNKLYNLKKELDPEQFEKFVSLFFHGQLLNLEYHEKLRIINLLKQNIDNWEQINKK